MANPPPPADRPARMTAAAQRALRQKAALKANMARRKAQVRARADVADEAETGGNRQQEK